MKFMKRTQIYKANNVTFNPKTLDAYSYDWWRFVEAAPTGGVIFNSYTYSNATAKHQIKVRNLLRTLGIEIVLDIKSPGGLQNLDSAVKYYEAKIINLKALIAKPGTRKAKNLERAQEIEVLEHKLVSIKNIIRLRKVAA